MALPATFGLARNGLWVTFHRRLFFRQALVFQHDSSGMRYRDHRTMKPPRMQQSTARSGVTSVVSSSRYIQIHLLDSC